MLPISQKCFATAEARKEEGAAVSTKAKSGALWVSGSPSARQGLQAQCEFVASSVQSIDSLF